MAAALSAPLSLSRSDTHPEEAFWRHHETEKGGGGSEGEGEGESEVLDKSGDDECHAMTYLHQNLYTILTLILTLNLALTLTPTLNPNPKP